MLRPVQKVDSKYSVLGHDGKGVFMPIYVLLVNALFGLW